MNTPRTTFLAALALTGAFAAPAAFAQFQSAPEAVKPKAVAPSTAANAQAYKKDGAKHIYAAYAKHIHKGKLAPLLYGVAIIETTIGPQGEVQDVKVVRQPAAAEVTPWAVGMIKAAAPFPPPAKMGSVTFTEIWLVNKQGRFQLDTLTEGQR